MTPEALSDIHQRAFHNSRGWSKGEFERLLADPCTALLTAGPAFLLVRLIVDEVEILTLATDPDAQRQGLARHLLIDCDTFCNTHKASRAVLEVAEVNQPAISLYQASGFRESGRRTGYYRTKSGQNVDALLFEKPYKRD